MGQSGLARHAAPAAIACCALAGASGCDTLRGSATPEAPSWLHHPGGALSVVVRRDVTAATRQGPILEEYERGRPEVDAAHRRVFVGSSDHGLYALRADDASLLWRFETLGAVQCEPLYDPGDDAVYFGSNDGALYKARASDGRLVWRFSTNGEVARKPVLRGGTLFVMNANDTLLALDPKTGAMKWNQHRTPAFGMEIGGYAGPAVAGDRVFAAFSDGVVDVFSAKDGAELWPGGVDLAAEAEQTAGGEAPKYLDVDTTPVVDHIASGEVAFVASYAGGVFALDTENGSRAWQNEKATGVTELVLWTQPAHRAHAGGPVTPARKVLLASSGLTGLWGIDPNEGRTLWHRNLPEGGLTAPVPVAGAVLVGTTRYGLFLFSPIDGALIDGIQTGSGFAMAPAAAGVHAFILSNGGSFLGLTVDPPPRG
jgi:outer membrane protein assembly factor BamB